MASTAARPRSIQLRPVCPPTVADAIRPSRTVEPLDRLPHSHRHAETAQVRRPTARCRRRRSARRARGRRGRQRARGRRAAGRGSGRPCTRSSPGARAATSVRVSPSAKYLAERLGAPLGLHVLPPALQVPLLDAPLVTAGASSVTGAGAATRRPPPGRRAASPRRREAPSTRRSDSVSGACAGASSSFSPPAPRPGSAGRPPACRARCRGPTGSAPSCPAGRGRSREEPEAVLGWKSLWRRIRARLAAAAPRFSSTVTAKPRWASSCAALRPPAPPPSTATVVATWQTLPFSLFPPPPPPPPPFPARRRRSSPSSPTPATWSASRRPWLRFRIVAAAGLFALKRLADRLPALAPRRAGPLADHDHGLGAAAPLRRRPGARAVPLVAPRARLPGRRGRHAEPSTGSTTRRRAAARNNRPPAPGQAPPRTDLRLRTVSLPCIPSAR